MLNKLIQREPVRVAYTVIIALEGVASALLTALEHKPANLSALGLAFLTAAAGELARGRVTPVTVSDEDAAVSSLLGDLDNKVPAIHPYVELLEHDIPPEERHKLEGLLTQGSERDLGKAMGLSDDDIARLVDKLQSRGLVVPASQPAVKPGDPTETAPEPGQAQLATPPQPPSQ